MEFSIGATAFVALVAAVFFGYGTYGCFVYKDTVEIMSSDIPKPWVILAVLTVLCFCISVRYWFLFASFY